MPRKPSVSRRERATLRRVERALREMRQGQSLTAAAKRAGTTPKTVRVYGEPALDHLPTGHYRVRPSDQLPRRMRTLTPKGAEVVAVRGFAAASRLARYWNAVDHFLRTGDTTRLGPFRRRGLTSRGRFFPFITDPRMLDRLAAAGEVRFEDLYETIS